MLLRTSRFPTIAAVLALLIVACLFWWTARFEDAFTLAPLGFAGHDERPSSGGVLQGEMINGGDNFKNRFKQDEHYLLSGHIAGWNNQVISHANTIHLALLTSRIPILPAFLGHPGQLGGVSLVTDPDLRLPFSAVFDLPRLVSALREKYPGWKGVVEWTDVVELGHWPRNKEGDGQQPSSSSSKEEWWELGCWQCFPDPLDFAFEPYHIKPIFTDVPAVALPSPLHPQLEVLAAYLHPDSLLLPEYLSSLNTTIPPHLLPDTSMVCIDNLYFATSSPTAWSPSEWDGEYGPEVGAWPTVGREMRWSEDLERKGRIVARRLFGQADQGEGHEEKEEWEMPAYIAVHIRHGDFLNLAECPELSPSNTTTTISSSCLPASSYIALVAEVQHHLLLLDPPRIVDRVVFATDETDPTFLAELEAQIGWVRVEEELSAEIREMWGDWYPMLIDNWLLSNGVGFVGTYGSTMSILAARRVREWNGGISRQVRV